MQVPDLARSVALQEEKFIAFRDGLNHILHRYHHVLASLSEPEVRTYYSSVLKEDKSSFYQTHALSCRPNC